ncbi:MAG TPA: hypothetical protein VF771_13755 [Longimicrobiaceae bacterium]
MGACRGDRPPAGEGGTPQDAPPPASADAGSDSSTATQGAFTVTGRPVVTREDSIREAIIDSTREAQLYHRRQQSMETLESCLAKARAAEGPQRAVLEAACRRSRGTQR